MGERERERQEPPGVLEQHGAGGRDGARDAVVLG